MDSNKFFPKIIGETKLGVYYVSSNISLKTDENMTTIWLDLETKKEMFHSNKKGGYDFPISRVSLNTKQDFSLIINNKILTLLEFFKQQSIPIPHLIQIIFKPEILEEENPQLFNFFKEEIKKLNESDLKQLKQISDLVQKLNKISLKKLLDERRYSLIFGNLDLKDQIENKVATQLISELKKQKLTKKDIEDCFGGIVLSDNTFNEVFTYLGIKDILSNPPKFPNSGGAIFIDQGGTGKSLMKSSLKKLWKKLEGEVIEKNGIAEFTGDINYARLIMSWYFGNSNPQEQGYDKEGLFNASIRTKVPSLLIVDEADRFVKSSDDEYEKDRSAELIITEFKRYLTSRDKGGVLGNVITVFIANVEENNLNPQLKMGGERLYPIYFGPPSKEEEWLELINLYIKESELVFIDRNNEKDLLLVRLLLTHNSSVPHEKYMISPRRLGPNFCGNYLKNYFKEDNEGLGSNSKKPSRTERLFSMLHRKEKNESFSISYNDFLKHFIDDMLLKQIKLAKLDLNDYRTKYYDLINLNLSDNTESETFDPNNNSENEEINSILNDPDGQRIISARNINEVFGQTISPTYGELRFIYISLLKKFYPDNYQSKEAKEFGTILTAKINEAFESFQHPNKTEFNYQNYNFSKFT